MKVLLNASGHGRLDFGGIAPRGLILAYFLLLGGGAQAQMSPQSVPLSVPRTVPQIVRGADASPRLVGKVEPPADDASLAFLRHVILPASLADAVNADIGSPSLRPEERRASIFARLRLELAARDSFDPKHLSASAPRGTFGRFDRFESQLSAMATRARDAKPIAPREGLAGLVTDDQVIKMTNIVFQTRPGQDIARPDDVGGPSRPQNVSGVGFPSMQQTVPGMNVAGTASDRLTDCGIPFNQLPNNCGVGPDQRCEKYDSREFAEVAEIRMPGSLCTGTLIANQWVLTAAHCVLPNRSAADYRKTPGAELNGHPILTQSDQTKFSVQFAVARSLPAGLDQFRRVKTIYVHPDWVPAPSTVATIFTPTFLGDMALIEIEAEQDFSTKVPPARLASASYSGFVTGAGYGMTTLGAGNVLQFAVTWPQRPVMPTAADQIGSDQAQVSTFCLGDSGGPAFAGRHRGCPAQNPPASAEAPRPRVVAGVVSYHTEVVPATNTTTCQDARVSRYSDVAAPRFRTWICSVTNNAAGGCL